MPHQSASPNPASGISLMESMTVIGIMTIILVIVTQIFAVNNVTVARALARTDDDNGAAFATRRLGEFTRGAVTVLSSYTINGTSYASSATALVLKVPSVDSSGNVIAATFDYMAIYRDGTKTTQIKTDTQPGAGSVRVSGKKLLTDYNQTMTFSYNDPIITEATRVSIFIVNQQVVRGSTLTTKAWTSIFLRNH